MKITAQEEYGLRCLVAVARHTTTNTHPLAIREIARTEGLSTQYVAKLMNLLKKHQLVESVRGLSGGFRLARPAEDVRVIEILAALGGAFDVGSHEVCNHFTGQEAACVHLSNCSMRSMWSMILRHITEFLQYLTLHDLLTEEHVANQRMTQYMERIVDDQRELHAREGASI